MTSTKPISNSCQSIASASAATANATPTSGALYINGTGSLGRLKYHQKHKSLDASDEELEYTQLSKSTHTILGRVKSDRFLASKSDEDRRRRTIIVEKKNDSYGFTLQSYGIHYKRNREVEMLTYVDYVEYDGPAYKAGMREGDVILSINGRDMERADHKTLVDFIKSCDGRMRMVVLFEDCVRKVNLHLRYIHLQKQLQAKMHELERICLRERELLEGKWKTHSLPARKKATTSPSDADIGLSPTDADAQNLPYYRPTLSTEDVANMAKHQVPQTIIPPPAQYMYYFDPTYRYILKPSTSNSSGEFMVSVGEGLHHSPSEQRFLRRAESADSAGTATASTAQCATQRRQPPTPPPRTCEKHKPPSKQQQQQQQLQQQQQQQQQQYQHHQKPQHKDAHAQEPHKSGKHCHGHSCNPCIGHFRWKSAEKATVMAGNGNGNSNGDNVSLDAYDLASPCCDTHCVPSRRRSRHHKEHTHKHKHRDRDRERESKERTPRPKSQSHVSAGTTKHHHHHHHIATDAAQYQHQHQHQHQLQQHQHQHYQDQQQVQQPRYQQQQNQQQQQPCDSRASTLRSRYFDLTAGLASHCSLHSCTSSEFGHADSTSYGTTSLSTDTIHWDQKSDNASMRQQSIKSRQSYQPHELKQQQQQQQQQNQQQFNQQQPQAHVHNVYQRYHITATQIQPSQIYPNTAYVHKPKSWDNLTTKTIGGYGFGYGYLDTVTQRQPVKLQVTQQRNHSMPRKNPYGRYSTYTDVENYAPPPSQFVEQLTTTTTTITAKSTEELFAATGLPQTPCDCMTKQQQQVLKTAQFILNQNQKFSHQNSCQLGYYSHLPPPTADVGNVTATTSAKPGSTGTAVPPDITTVSEVTRL